LASRQHPRTPADRPAPERTGLDKVEDGEVKISGGELSISWLVVRLTA
jgi:hypothetical protein